MGRETRETRGRFSCFIARNASGGIVRDLHPSGLGRTGVWKRTRILWRCLCLLSHKLFASSLKRMCLDLMFDDVGGNDNDKNTKTKTKTKTK